MADKLKRTVQEPRRGSILFREPHDLFLLVEISFFFNSDWNKDRNQETEHVISAVAADGRRPQPAPARWSPELHRNFIRVSLISHKNVGTKKILLCKQP